MLSQILIGTMYGPDFPPGHVQTIPSGPFFLFTRTADEPETLLSLAGQRVNIGKVNCVVIHPGTDESVAVQMLKRNWTVLPSLEVAAQQLGTHWWLSRGSVDAAVINADLDTKEDWIQRMVRMRLDRPDRVRGDTFLVTAKPARDWMHGLSDHGVQVVYPSPLAALDAFMAR